MLAGFDRHYALFRYNAQQAKARYEAADWHGIRKLARERIAFYDRRVAEAVSRIEHEFDAGRLSDEVWQQVKRDYVELLAEHQQPELAETFFNSVSCKVLHRHYFNNQFIFVRPAVATDYLDSDPPCFRVYYPAEAGLRNALRQMLIDVGLACGFVDVERDLDWVIEAAADALPATPAADFQLHALRTLFFRNKGAYLIGRIVNDGEVTAFAIPILQDSRGRLYLDTLLVGSDRIEALFNFARAYFMVDMEVPSACVRFLRTLMPTKPESELYTMLGLHKQGKTLFYRDLLQHLQHSHDRFVIAPGIRGLIMAVFTLPSFPYVFKAIMDERGKDVTREHVQRQYLRVKLHDRVGRMADTWEYTGVPLPKARLDPALIEHLRATASSLLEDDGDALVIRHLYIERRMVPLNLYLEQADDAERERAVIEYGDAIKQMVAANMFPGDMLYKNFGVTRQGRVVFYDYDEVAYLTDCNFRRIPPPPNPEDELSAEPWYPVAAGDVFPEEFGPFLLGDPRVRDVFLRHHGDLLQVDFWQRKQQRIRDGVLEDVFPYPESLRFKHRRGQSSIIQETSPGAASAAPSGDAADAPAEHSSP
jgi:isocitrate dehydrogenase kinase/phosphatase